MEANHSPHALTIDHGPAIKVLPRIKSFVRLPTGVGGTVVGSWCRYVIVKDMDGVEHYALPRVLRMVS